MVRSFRFAEGVGDISILAESVTSPVANPFSRSRWFGQGLSALGS
jgi:hypothetical protein